MSNNEIDINDYLNSKKLQNYNLATMPNSSQVLVQDTLKLWNNNLINNFEHPFLRCRGLESLNLENKNVSIVTEFPGDYSDYVSTFNPKSVTEYIWHDIDGPLEIKVKKKNTVKTLTKDCALSKLYHYFDECDILWVPNKHFSNILILNYGLIVKLSTLIKETLVMPFSVFRDSIEGEDITPVFSIDGSPDNTLIYNDNFIRNVLHKNGFIQIHNMKKKESIYKVTNYHELKAYTLKLLEKPTLSTSPENICLQYYYAHKLEDVLDLR